MITTYTDTYEELRAYIDQQLKANQNRGAVQEAPFSSIQEGAIEKLEQYYTQQGYTFNWNVKDNLFVAKVSPKV